MNSFAEPESAASRLAGRAWPTLAISTNSFNVNINCVHLEAQRPENAVDLVVAHVLPRHFGERAVHDKIVAGHAHLVGNELSDEEQEVGGSVGSLAEIRHVEGGVSGQVRDLTKTI